MKIRRLFLLCLLCTLVLCGCTSREKAAPVLSEVTPTPAPTPAPTPEPVAFSTVAESSAVFSRSFASEDALRSYLSNLPAMAPEEPTAFSPVVCPEEGSDAVACEGDIQYVLSDGELIILRLTGGTAEKLSSVTAAMDWVTVPSADGASWQGGEKAPFAVYAADGRAAVISDRYGYTGGEGSFTYREYTAVDIYDCSDPAAPVLTASLGQSGGFVSASLTEGTLVVLTDYAPLSGEASLLPAMYDYDTPSPVSLDRVIGAAACESDAVTVAGAYGLSDGAADVRVLAGFSTDASVTGGRLFLAQSRMGSCDSRSYTLGEKEYNEKAHSLVTDLYVLPVTDGSFGAVSVHTVPGKLYAGAAIQEDNGGWVCLAERNDFLEAETPDGETVENAREEGLTLVRLDGAFAFVSMADLTEQRTDLTWAALGKGLAAYCADGALYAARTDDPRPVKIAAVGTTDGMALTYGEQGFLLFTEEGGKTVLRLLDGELQPAAALKLGDDFSRLLRQRGGVLASPEQGWIGLPANDSYCLYAVDKTGLSFRQDFFFRDWIWEVSARVREGYLILTDTQEILIHAAADLAPVSELEF